MNAALDRFLTKVRGLPSGCWEWTAARDKDGYGLAHAGGGNPRIRRAHRLGYELLIGDLPAGSVVDHVCRNRSCVNPTHLEPVTVRENTMRSSLAAAAINAIKESCPAGHPYSSANTRIYRGRRHCRACDKIRTRARSARRRAA